MRADTPVRDIFYSVSMDGIPGRTAEQRGASLQAVFRAFETWDVAAANLNLINVTPEHVDAGEAAIAPVLNPDNTGAGASIDVLWRNEEVLGITGRVRYAAPPTEAVQDEYTHIDVRLTPELGIIDSDAKGVRRLNNPLTNPFSTFTTQPLYDLESVALHEIGHALGLTHPDEVIANSVTNLFSPFARNRAEAADNRVQVRFVNEDNFFRAHPEAGLPEPPYSVHNQHEGSSSAVMNTGTLEGQISRTLTPDELGAIGIMYEDAAARTAAATAAAAASLSFGPQRRLAQDIVIERDMHVSFGNPPPPRENNDDMARQTLPSDSRLVGNLYESHERDPRDRYLFEVPEIPQGQSSVRMTFDIDAGREDPRMSDRSAKTGDLRLRILTRDGDGIVRNDNATAIDEGSLFLDDPFLAYDFTAKDFTMNGNQRRFIVEVSRQRQLAGFRDVDYILAICGNAGSRQTNSSACGCLACDADFGDAPDGYRTLLASDGPRYAEGGQQGLASFWDAEADGQPSSLADGDDASLSGGFPGPADDDDGVRFGDGFVDVTLRIEREGRSSYLLRAWWDVDRDGCFGHTSATACNRVSELFIDDLLMLESGVYTRRYLLPFDPHGFFSRFRLSWDPVERDVWPYREFVSQADGISHGEVEDYAVPEPASLILFGGGSLAMLALRRRRRSDVSAVRT